MATLHFLPGDPTWLPSDSHASAYGAVFEDDGETGYFYAVERRGDDLKILDAVHVYNVRNVVDREIQSETRIVWSPDGLAVALLLNDYAHAVFDFAGRLAYCRTGFPPRSGWSERGHAWDDAALDWLRR